jgi:hypothetical protein
MVESGQALKDLMLRATRAPPGVSSLNGGAGLTASIEHCSSGPARLIRVYRSGSERFRNILVSPGEPRPAFYPADIPFTARAFCNATWSEDFGLAVLWSLPVERLDIPSREELAALPQPRDSGAVEEFVRRFLIATKEDKLQMVQELSGLVGESFMRRIEETFGNIGQEELPAEAQALAADLITFHVQAGWEVSPDPAHSGPGHGWTLMLAERRRQLSQRSMLGMSTVALAERLREWPPGSARGRAP